MSISKFWPSPAQVNACIQPEAEVPPAAVLLAVHRPMEFQFVEGQEHRPVSQECLLERLLDPNVERGTALLTIRGSSGVGKSHAIRWLEAKLRAMPDSDSRHIILLPKSTSLKGAIKLILADLAGSCFDRLRDRLKTARDQVDLGEAAVRLRTNLEIEIGRRIEQAAAAVTSARVRGERALDKDASWQKHKSIRDVILHPSLRERWIGVGDKGEPIGVLAEVAARVLKEGRIVDENTRLQFKPDDLIFEPGELQEVAGETKSYLQRLSISGGQPRKEAIALLNSVIDEAANQLLDLGDTGLKDIFDEIRQELLRQNKELIVLIEDFAVLSGLQGALLDALIKEAIRDGENVRCTMRTALAVTTGYQLPATVLTRTTGDFLIEDMPFSDNESALNAVVQLVGRYLNAARVGRTELEAAYAKRGAKDPEWVPHFEDTIELDDSDRTMLAAFGTTPDEFHLFPFNRSALRQLATMRFGRTEQGEQKLEFKPRDILKFIVRKTLIENHSDFQEGKFPSANYYEADTVNRVSAVVTEEIRKFEPDLPKRGRVAAVVRFWGDNPTSSRRTEWKLPKKLLTAFGLRELDTAYVEPKSVGPAQNDSQSDGRSAPTAATRQADAKQTAKRAQPITPLDNWRATIDEWLAGRLNTLPQEEARQLRHWIASDVLATINWDVELLQRPADQHLRRFRDMVFLERAAGRGNASEEDCSILAVGSDDLKTPEAADALGLALHALIQWKLQSSWAFDENGESYARWAKLILPKRSQAISFLRKEYGSPLLSPAAKALYLGTRLLNIPGSHNENAESYINALFVDYRATNIGRGNPSNASNWDNLKNSAAQHRKSLQEFVLRFVGARTAGTDNPHALNFPALLSALGDVQTSLLISSDQLSSSDEAELKPAIEHAKQIKNQLRTTLAKQTENLRQRLQHCSQRLGTTLNKDLIKMEIHDLVSRCSTVLGTPYESCQRLREAVQAFADSSYQHVDSVAASEPQTSLLAFAASVDEQSLAVAESFLEDFRKFTAGVENKLRLSAGSSGIALLKSEQNLFQKEIAETCSIVGVNHPALNTSTGKDKPNGLDAKSRSERKLEGTVGTCELLLQCHELSQQLADYADRERYKSKADSLRVHRERFQSARAKLEGAMKPWKVLESQRVPGLTRPPTVAVVRKGLPEMFARITDKPEQMNAGRVMTECLEGLDSLVQAYIERAEVAWIKHKETALHVAVQLPLVKTFLRIPGFSTKASELEDAINDLNAKLLTIPITHEQWAQCEAAYKLYEQLLKKLPLGNLPKDVRAFLEGTVAGGAALSSLTEEVQAWIKKHGLDKSFVIRSVEQSPHSGRLL